MAAYTLTCVDCGTAAQASRKDAKLCKSCRFLKVLAAASKHAKRSFTCRMCKAKFLPIQRGDYALCGDCCTAKHGTPEAACVVCAEVRPTTEGLAVCRPCVKDPAIRPRVVKALRKGRRERQVRHAADWAAVKRGERPIVKLS